MKYVMKSLTSFRGESYSERRMNESFERGYSPKTKMGATRHRQPYLTNKKKGSA